MNQQMHKLYNQSMTAHRIENRPGDVFTKSFSAELDANKFADLIVKECMRVADSSGKGWAHLTGTPGNRIKQHFGVEV